MEEERKKGKMKGRKKDKDGWKEKKEEEDGRRR